MKFISFIFGKHVFKISSLLIKFILLFKGIKVGANFYIEGVPKLKLNAKINRITIGNNVQIFGDIDIRTRENGSISIHDNVKIDCDCRFVAAREGKIVIGKSTNIATGAIFNGGGDIIIGENCIFGPRNILNANEHIFKKEININQQGFIHKSIKMGNDCWTGAYVVVSKGVIISDKSVIGANSFVNKDTEKFSINAGIPSRKIGERE
tara:strand:- start:2845 stop:3468 length:624 start_codon:yes stop_codon:yes gene_type:complete